MEYAIKNNDNYESIEFNSDAVQTKSKSNQIMLQAKIDDDNFVDYQRIPQKETVTVLNIPMDVTLKLVSKSPFSYTIPDHIPHYYNKTIINPYLYTIEYGNIDYEYAQIYFAPILGACSSVRNGNFFGRNFDWTYDHAVTFVVQTPSSEDRYASIGVSGTIPGIIDDNADSDEIIYEGVDMFKLLPFYMLDGINEKGVFMCANILPLDDEDSPTNIVYAKKEEKDYICATMLIRFVLDKFKTANEAISYLTDYTTIYIHEDVIEKGYQLHFMIGDMNNTYVIEFIDGELKIVKSKVMTNFNLYGTTFNEGKVIYPNPSESGINEYGFGLERFNIIQDNYKKSNTLEGMFDTMDEVKYSNCYGEYFWTSELVKGTDDDGEIITVDTPSYKCSTLITEMKNRYETKDRDDANVWITTHSSIYDIKEKKLYIQNQEFEVVYLFTLK